MADKGGHSLEELVKRAMKYLMSDELARTYNVTGQFGKSSFQKTKMFVAMSGMYHEHVVNTEKSCNLNCLLTVFFFTR